MLRPEGRTIFRYLLKAAFFLSLRAPLGNARKNIPSRPFVQPSSSHLSLIYGHFQTISFRFGSPLLHIGGSLRFKKLGVCWERFLAEYLTRNFVPTPLSEFNRGVLTHLVQTCSWRFVSPHSISDFGLSPL